MLVLNVQISSLSSFTIVPTSVQRVGVHVQASSLSMSLKPAALPLMDSGKALARSGEFLIDLTSALDLYGGALSAAGANIRNGGDSVAQAAASCRFKTGTELVIDELREAGTCLTEAASKLKEAVVEAEEDGQPDFAKRIGTYCIPCDFRMLLTFLYMHMLLFVFMLFMGVVAPWNGFASFAFSHTYYVFAEATVVHFEACSVALEAAGAGILLRKPLATIGLSIAAAGADLEQLSFLITALDADKVEAKDAGQRVTVAAEKMIEAGNALQGVAPKPSKKSWLKGGSA
jgi:hypothetical protein